MSGDAGTLIQRIPSRKSSSPGLNLSLSVTFHTVKEEKEEASDNE